MTSTVCLNCGKKAEFKYCQHCGQATTVSRLTWTSLVEEVTHFFTHVEHGFLKTNRMVLFHFGTFVQSFLQGRRKNVQKPVAFLLIWIAISLLSHNAAKWITGNEHLRTASIFTGDGEIFEFYSKHISLVETLVLPFISLAVWLILGRPKLNYVEVVAVTFYNFSVSYMIYALLWVIACFFDSDKSYNLFFDTAPILYLVWSIYATYDFYKRYTHRHFILRLVVFFCLAVVIRYIGVNLISSFFINLH
jgi:hypothetical protein